MRLGQLDERRGERVLAEAGCAAPSAQTVPITHTRSAAAEGAHAGGDAADDEAAGRLAEQDPQGIVVVIVISSSSLDEGVQPYLGAEPARQAALGQGYGEAALGDVVGAGEPADAHGAADGELGGAHRRDVDLGQLRRGAA